MEKGWIKLYRKVLNHEVFKCKDDKLFKTFIYCLLRANHKDTKVYFNRQTVQLKAGQFITGREQASRDLGYSPKTFDRKINDLLNEGILTRYMTRRFSIISITNWETYQRRPGEDDPLHDPLHDPLNGTNLTTDKKNKEVKKKDPEDFSSFLERYSPEQKEIIDRAFKAISQTRKSGKVADSILLTHLKTWEKYSSEQVEGGIRTYLEKSYHLEGKDEKYLLGIIRKQKTHLPLKNDSPEKDEGLMAARRREIETVESIPCPSGVKPDFLKERET